MYLKSNSTLYLLLKEFYLGIEFKRLQYCLETDGVMSNAQGSKG